MIVWHEKVKKSEDIVNAVINELYKENIMTDGTVEIFNNGKEEGCVLKIFDRYNPNLDMCFWIYLPSNRKVNNEVEVIIGKHVNCNEINMWDGADLDSYTFSDGNAREMHNKVRSFIIDSIKENMNKTRSLSSL